MLAEYCENSIDIYNNIEKPFKGVHDLLLIDVTDRGYPDEDYDIILPNPEPKDMTMKVGLVDQIMPSYWTTTLISFPASGKILNDAKLKSSLAQALGILPALSGRIVTKEGKPYNSYDHKRNLQIDLVCPNRGAWFTSQKSDANFNILHKDLFSFEVHEPTYLFSRAQKAVVSTKSPPLLAVKATHFKCASALITVMVNHIINDGRSTYLFMQLWGQLYRDLEPSFVHDTRLLYKGEMELSPEAQIMFDDLSLPPPPYKSLNFPFKTVRFSITKKDMLILKQNCNVKYKDEYISSDDLFCAVVWRAIVRARQFSPETLASFQRVLDIRSSYGLKKDSAYGCGVLGISHPYITYADLVSMPLHELALTFRTTLKAHDNKYITDFINACSKLEYPSYANRLNDHLTGPHLLASSYNQFNNSQIHFHTPADLNIRALHPSGQLHIYPPSATHYFGLVGLAVENVPAILSDTEVTKWGFKVEVAPYEKDIVNHM